MKKIFVLLLPFIFLLKLPVAEAHCPLCTAAVGAAAVSAQYYGVDASIIGVLIGAFGISTGLWFGLKITKKFIPFQTTSIVIGSFLLTVIPLLALNSDTVYMPMLLLGAPGTILNKVYWINKMLLGSIIGGTMTLVAYGLHTYIKRVNGKVLFPFQGIVFTVALLSVTSSILFFVFR